MFDNLIGNQKIKEVLRRMIASARVPGALCFVGDEGVGKKLFALELAKAFVCRNPQTDGEACDHCAACVRAGKFDLPKSNDRDDNEKLFFSEHPDVGLLRPAGKFITIAQVRELDEQAHYRPFEAARRFFLVTEADQLNEPAANALLKTLEEPPATTHLILLTARPNSLLQTIRSRCQMIRFAPLAPEEIENYLSASKKVSPNDVKLLSRIARGSLGKALSLDLEIYKQQREQMLNVLDALAFSPDRARLLKIAEDLNEAKLKDEYEARLEVLENLIYDVWTLRLGTAKDLINADLETKLAKFASDVDSRRAQMWLSEIETLRENLVVNINRKIATDALFMKMAAA